MTPRNRTKAWLLPASVAAAMSACGLATQAQTAKATTAPPGMVSAAGATSPLSLRHAFEAAWARQPEALALQARRDAARAQQGAAKAWTPEPAALELSNKTDRMGNNNGAREVEVGIAVPLWLPGERGSSAGRRRRCRRREQGYRGATARGRHRPRRLVAVAACAYRGRNCPRSAGQHPPHRRRRGPACEGWRSGPRRPAPGRWRRGKR